VLEVGKRYTSPSTGTWAQVVERTPERMLFERGFAPGTGRAGGHLHEDFTQTWEALSGEGRIEVDGTEREFRTGDRVEIPPNTKHRDPWNPSDAELHARGTFAPPNDFIEAYADAWAHQLALGEDGKLTDQDEPSLLQILVVAKQTDGRSYGASPPVPIQKASLPLLAAVGRLRGFKPSYD
jgi:mannose-6-phosphate isomerase-like protein (cupin superfamily)